MSGRLKVFAVVCCFSATVTIAVSGHRTEEEREEAEAVLGVHVETLAEPLWYNVIVPVLFEIPLPKWSLSELSPKWPPGFGSDCNEDDHFADNWGSMACPINFHFNQILKRAHENLFPWNDLMPTLDEKPAEAEFLCNSLSPHFNSLVITEEEKEKYIQAIKRCPPREFVYLNVTDSDYVKDVDAEVYDTMLKRFTEEFSSPAKYRLNGFIKYPTTINAQMNIQLALLMEYYETSRMYSDALATCSNFRLPSNIISKKDLSSALEEIKNMFTRKNYDLTLPQEDLDAYYRKELTDCVLTTKSTLLVRILVPLKKLDYPLSLFRLTPMEFLRTVKMNKTEVCHFGSGSTHYIKDANLEHFFVTECSAREFCRVPDITNRVKVNSCVQSLLTEDKDKALNHCTLFCQHIPKKSLPIFRRIDKDRYVIAGKSTEMEIFVSCGNKPFKVVTPPMDFGSLEVILPCNCQIVYKAETLFSYGDCQNNLVSIRPIIPHHWTNANLIYDPDENMPANASIMEQGLQVAPEKEMYDNIMFYMNLQFTIISIIIIVIIFANIAMCYMIVGVMQRLHKLPGLHQSGIDCSRIGSLCGNGSVFNCNIKHDEL